MPDPITNQLTIAVTGLIGDAAVTGNGVITFTFAELPDPGPELAVAPVLQPVPVGPSLPLPQAVTADAYAESP